MPPPSTPPGGSAGGGAGRAVTLAFSEVMKALTGLATQAAVSVSGLANGFRSQAAPAVRPVSIGNYVQAGQAAQNARQAVTLGGGTDQAAGRAATAAFTESLKALNGPAADAGKSLTGVASGFRTLALTAVQSVVGMHLMRTAISALQSSVVQFVEKANPAAVIRFKLAVDDLNGVIGRILVPVLETATGLVRRMADHLYAFSPAAKTLIAGLVGAGVGLAVAIGVATVATVVWTAAVYLFTNAATLGLSSIVQILGSVLSVSAGVTAGFALAVGTMDQFKTVMDTLMPLVGQTLDALASAILPLVQAVLPLVIAGVEVFGAMVEKLIPIIRVVAVVIGALAEGFLLVTEVILRSLGFLQGAKGPDRAPSAVRHAQTGDIGGFINKQYQRSLEGGGGDKKDVAAGHLEKIKDAVEAIERFLINAKEAGGQAIDKVKQVTQYDPLVQGVRFAMRQLGI